MFIELKPTNADNELVINTSKISRFWRDRITDKTTIRFENDQVITFEITYEKLKEILIPVEKVYVRKGAKLD